MLERNIHTYTIKEQLELHKAQALVLGCGGGGCSMAEVLCRTGVGNITIVDFDRFEDSNRNRQLGAMVSTLGRPKVEVIKERLEDINPDCNVTAVFDTINENNYKKLMGDKDIILDAVDKQVNKKLVGRLARSLGKTYVTGGLGGYNFWCATLKNKSIDDIFKMPDIPNYPCAAPVLAQAALQAQQGINYYLDRHQNALDKIVKVNMMMLCMSVEDIE